MTNKYASTHAHTEKVRLMALPPMARAAIICDVRWRFKYKLRLMSDACDIEAVRAGCSKRSAIGPVSVYSACSDVDWLSGPKRSPKELLP